MEFLLTVFSFWELPYYNCFYFCVYIYSENVNYFENERIVSLILPFSYHLFKKVKINFLLGAFITKFKVKTELHV